MAATMKILLAGYRVEVKFKIHTIVHMEYLYSSTCYRQTKSIRIPSTNCYQYRHPTSTSSDSMKSLHPIDVYPSGCTSNFTTNSPSDGDYYLIHTIISSA